MAGLGPSPNTLPNKVAVVLTCGVDDGSKTRNCRPLAGRPSREDEAVLSDVAARPAYRPGARPDSSVLTITAEGALVGCWRSSVDPQGEAFDLATLMLTTVLKMKPLTRSGAPVEGGVYVLTNHFENVGRRAVLRLDAP